MKAASPNCSISAGWRIGGPASSPAASASALRSVARCWRSRGSLLLDEPLGSLDEQRKAEILPYLVRLRDEADVPMVYVSHDADEMRRLATQVVMLRRGRVIMFGGVEVLDSSER